MNDADKFLRDADALLRGDIPMTDDADEQALRLLARDLMTADFSAETDLDALRPAALRANMKGKPRMSRRARTLLTIAAVVSLVAAAFLTVPPLRAFAQEILRQIGIYNVTDGATYYERMQMPFEAIEFLNDEGAIVEPMENPDFARVWFGKIPEGYSAVGYQNVRQGPDRYYYYARTVYARDDNPDIGFSVNASSLADPETISYEAGDPVTEDVMVRGIPGVWVQRFNDRPDIESQMLIFPFYPYRVWVESTGLSRDEVVDISSGLLLLPVVLSTSEMEMNIIKTPMEMAAEIGAPLAVIGELPEGYGVTWRSGGRTDRGISVYTNYNSYASMMQGNSMFYLSQEAISDATAEPWPLAVGDAPVADVTVNGNPGIWIEDTYANSIFRHNILMWTQAGYTMRIAAIGFNRDEMLAIAGSVVFIDERFEGEYEEPLLPTIPSDLRRSIFVPDYLPEGFELLNREITYPNSTVTVLSTFADADGSGTFTTHQMIDEGAYPSPESVLEGITAEDVTVNLWRGLWFESYLSDQDTSVRMLTWPQYRFRMQIQSASLDKDEMLRIAESMRKSISMDPADFE